MYVKISEGKTAAGPQGIWQTGDVVKVSEEVGLGLIKAGAATLVTLKRSKPYIDDAPDPGPEPEAAATEGAPETTAKPATRKRGRPRKVTSDDRGTGLAKQVRPDDSDSGDNVSSDAS
jgi:hypothetical protein